MPITIPPFAQYQAPIVPLRGLWNSKPPEGDMYAQFEIDWLTTTGNLSAVQIALNMNSPVALSQLVAMMVDNRRCGYDVDFLFPDSGYLFTVPAYNQLVAPIFTNALTFYASADGVVAGNQTNFMVFNSMPPPVAWNPTAMQTFDSVNNIQLENGTTQLLASTVSGTLNGFVITVNFAQTGVAQLVITDGSGAVLWHDGVSGTSGNSQVVTVSGLAIKFVDGLSLTVSGATFPAAGTGGVANVNLFYTTP